MPSSTETGHPEREKWAFKAVTLQDVADAAGVTPMTVSRAIKGRKEVAPATRERVLQVARELNYSANLTARALATGKTGIIAVLSGSLNQFYYANIVHLLESHITGSGLQMRLMHSDSDLRHLVSSTHASTVDGVIVVGETYLYEKLREFAPHIFEACVFIDTAKHEETDHIQCNMRPAIEEALGLMLKAGRKRVAYITHTDGPLEWKGPVSPRELLEGALDGGRLRIYLEAMERAGRLAEVITTRRNNPVALRETTRNYIEKFGCPDAILCVNDETAMHVFRVLHDLKLRIPEDVLLVGCDGLPVTECFEPPLSTISQPTAEICAMAWQFLQARIAQPHLPRQQISFDATLTIRKSLQV